MAELILMHECEKYLTKLWKIFDKIEYQVSPGSRKFTRRTDENIANLLADSATYTDYIFENPSSGQTEHKKTYLKLHVGYVFCSGFYYTVFGVTKVE